MYQKFKKLLKEKGLKAADVARVTRIPPSTFSDWKKGKSKPKVEKLQKIADFFNIPITEFLESEVEDDE